MMKIDSNILIDDLVKRTEANIHTVEKFKNLSTADLKRKAKQNSWNILECIEHLNLYGDFYIPEIRSNIEKSKNSASPFFKSGFLGNYFAKSLEPKAERNKMKTFKDKNPAGLPLDSSVLERFIAQQNQILILLLQSRHVDLNQTKTAISLTKWFKIKLGDSFRVLIYHNERHLQQALRNLNENQS